MSNIVRVVDFDADLDRPFPISARELWRGLGFTKDFSNWIKDQIKILQMVEGVDYISLALKGERNADGDIIDVETVEETQPTRKAKAPKKRGKRGSTGGDNRIEYFLTINVTKHIGLKSDKPKGHEYRQALIDLEMKVESGKLSSTRVSAIAEAKAVLDFSMFVCRSFRIPEHIAQIHAAKEVLSKTGVDISSFLLLSPAQDQVKAEETMLEPTEIGRVLGLGSAVTVNRWLAAKGYQVKKGGVWEPTAAGKPHSFKHSWSKGSKSGYNLKWNVAHLKGLLGVS